MSESEFVSINPASGDELARYAALSPAETQDKILRCHQAFLKWEKVSPQDRASALLAIARQLEGDREQLAGLITQEMGKPLRESRSELDKCAWACRHFAEMGQQYLRNDCIELDESRANLIASPLGVIFAVMPWNFPFWQVFRALAPALVVGNTLVLKGASNVPGCSQAIERLVRQAGLPDHVVTNLAIRAADTGEVIANPLVRGVTLTGSEAAGRAVASLAGTHLKKCVLELGGQDPYIILEDADIALASQKCVQIRMLCSGQVCIAAKRLIVVEAVYDAFRTAVLQRLELVHPSDPMDEQCSLGPLARRDLRDQVHQQVQASVATGSDLIHGGMIPDQPGWWYPATVLENVQPGSVAFDDEVFGPVVSIVRAKDETEAMELANSSRFGLGTAIFSANRDHALALASEQLQAGSIAINDFVKSDPRVPFGGCKDSGFGRELGKLGIHEFVNIKSIVMAN
ncbi:Succinate semialdehyde dehydrogenase [NAD(P)+] Sad [Synechococcus sp. MIT S9509]|uniref:NAD-dependent succinate-semialdehyde dehydrogenase n=1 Tax=unclassified Synechococcus TaxID=2626047 RepID=UPI0007BB01C2|nr:MULTISPECIES: NAD-dependent succinate-semialdehyde dehydrogenase [unclassified Synechococcus]KZR85484.1 Succinate semialdehyde dehydrogenase [NAD(P)+] Sad [Synechococcus sp. MIT S9504]KZR90379.1 Succinate semialdehyde dehydrogenase [NAD(P)+] Sad [Synechococcus sp. MIT S9509]